PRCGSKSLLVTLGRTMGDVFPEYRTRNGQVNALQDRINDCFERSMNGKPLPYDSDEMRGILAYIWWLSRDVRTGVAVKGRGFARVSRSRPADPQRGESYAQKCAACHSADGQGRRGPNGEYLFPALWGPESFNIGAGMARLSNAAGFVKTNMPIGQGRTLTDADAVDVAAYFIRQPRPDFPAKMRDWPKGASPMMRGTDPRTSERSRHGHVFSGSSSWTRFPSGSLKVAIHTLP